MFLMTKPVSRRDVFCMDTCRGFHSSNLTSNFFHHIRAVSAITDAMLTPCENHSQIVAVKRVPAYRGGARTSTKNHTLFEKSPTGLPNGL